MLTQEKEVVILFGLFEFLEKIVWGSAASTQDNDTVIWGN